MKTKLRTLPENKQVSKIEKLLKNSNFRNNQSYIISNFGRKKAFDFYFIKQNIGNKGIIFISEEFIKNKIQINESKIFELDGIYGTNNRGGSFFFLIFFTFGSFLMINNGINYGIIILFFLFGLILSYLFLKVQNYDEHIYLDYIIGKLDFKNFFIYRYK